MANISQKLKIIPRFFLKKQPLPSKKRVFYETYRSLADPVYHPHLEESEFWQSYSQVQNVIETEIYHDPFARAILYGFAKQALAVKGDFIECGVHHGGGSHLLGFVLDRFDTEKRMLWAFDSFEGLSEPCSEDMDVRTNRSFFKKNDLSNSSLDNVSEILKQHQCALKIVPGWIPNSFDCIGNATFSFVHIDVDLYQPTLDSLSFLYQRLNKGGVILFDDYGFPMCLGVKKAVDEFFQERQESVIPLPTGQAIIIKI